jgi:D-alanine-D-alanine ligase
MTIALLLGGISPERNISLLSGRAVTKALRELGHTVYPIDPATGLLKDADLAAATAAPVSEAWLAAAKPERIAELPTLPEIREASIVFNVLHGKYGEDGYVQSILDLHGIKYTGSGMLASAVAMDKAMSKMLFQVAGIPTPYWVTVRPDQATDDNVLEEIRREINGSMVVKPNDQGSTVGMSIVHSGVLEDISAAIIEAGRYSETILVERFIEGRELTVAVLGNDALPIVEIIPNDGFYDYTHKYTKGQTEYECPANLSEDVRDHVMNLAVTAHQVLGCKTISRVDFRLTEENVPVCLEVNTSPGFTELSLVPMAAREAGIEFGPLCEEIIRLSLEGAEK